MKDRIEKNVVKVRNVCVGEGRPKICVPIIGITKEEILKEAKTFHNYPIDIVEWRVDWFEDVLVHEKVEDVLKELRCVLGEIPILFTFRSLKEGGKKSIPVKEYANLNIAMAKTGYVDLVDVEAFTGDDIVREMIEAIHTAGVKVIASNHDFNQTPKKDDIVKRLCKMQELGADIPKIAVMPQSKKDVLILLEATEEMAMEHANRPIITMSMDGTGVISRLVGEAFGSALTFGTVTKASAPGQIDVNELETVLNIINKSMSYR